MCVCAHINIVCEPTRFVNTGECLWLRWCHSKCSCIALWYAHGYCSQRTQWFRATLVWIWARRVLTSVSISSEDETFPKSELPTFPLTKCKKRLLTCINPTLRRINGFNEEKKMRHSNCCYCPSLLCQASCIKNTFKQAHFEKKKQISTQVKRANECANPRLL